MSQESFQLINKEPIDESIWKRHFVKLYHQDGAQLKDSGQNIEFNLV